MLHLGRIRLLVELDRRETVAAVASALDYTPSAVSQQLAQLEREIGRPLLERIGRGVQLTDAGRTLVAHGVELLSRADAAEAELRGAAAVAGTLRSRRPRAAWSRPRSRDSPRPIRS
jgi:DNA-binding transcriptional LysR family regulator